MNCNTKLKYLKLVQDNYVVSPRTWNVSIKQNTQNLSYLIDHLGLSCDVLLVLILCTWGIISSNRTFYLLKKKIPKTNSKPGVHEW